MGKIIPSKSLSRVTYTGIDGMHSQKTKQPCIRSARKNTTRKKSAVDEDPRNRPENNKNNTPKRTNYMKTALQIVMNGDTEDRKA